MKSKRQVLRTLYVVGYDDPDKIEITKNKWDRILTLQKMIRAFPLRKGESIIIYHPLKRYPKGSSRDEAWLKLTVLDLDIGYFGWDGFVSYLNKRYTKLEELPEVFFSEAFIWVPKDPELSEEEKEEFIKIVTPKHRELLNWKRMIEE